MLVNKVCCDKQKPNQHQLETLILDIVLNNNSEEIEACFRVPVKFVLKDKRHRNDEINRDGDRFFMPAYKFDSYIIWGLTAMMTVDFLNVALDANIDLKTKGN